MPPIYTKSFGGKIWKNLHSVSPGNFFHKKFKMVSLENFPPNIYFNITSCKKLRTKRGFLSNTVEKHLAKIF